MEKENKNFSKFNKKTIKNNDFSNKNANFYEKKEKIDYKKSLGQNFLYDKNLLNAIAKDSDVSKDDIVLLEEIRDLLKEK